MVPLQNRNLATLLIGVLGAVKLILQAFGIDIITNAQIDAIANGLAALITVIGVAMTHLKHTTTAVNTVSSSAEATSSGTAPSSAPPQNLTFTGHGQTGIPHPKSSAGSQDNS